MFAFHTIRMTHTCLQAAIQALVSKGDIPVQLSQALSAIVRRSSLRQAAAGLLSAGLGRSLQYVGSKVAKAWR